MEVVVSPHDPEHGNIRWVTTLQRSATGLMIVGIAGLLLFRATDLLPVQIFGGGLLVVGGLGEAVVSVMIVAVFLTRRSG